MAGSRQSDIVCADWPPCLPDLETIGASQICACDLPKQSNISIRASDRSTMDIRTLDGGKKVD